MKRLAALLLVAAPVVGLAACSDDDDADSADTTGTTAEAPADSTTSSFVEVSPTIGPADTTTTAPVTDATDDDPSDGPDGGDGESDGPAIPTDPQDYAEALIGAWESGDAATAHVLATDEAFDALFAQEGGGPGTWHLEGCEGAAGSSYCTFGAGGDPTVIVRVLNEPASQASPQAVTEVRFEG